MSPARRALFQIHFCVLLWGFTAILGKLITLRALSLVWWRMWIVTAALLLVPRVWRGLRAMSGRLWLAYAGVGAVVSLHWLTFYGAIKLANASVAATCIALAPVFLALVEPYIAGRRFAPRELVLGVAVVPGVALVVGGLSPQMRVGALVGAVSALLVAVFSSLNKRLVEHADPLVVTCVEMGTGALFLTLLTPLMPRDPGVALFPLPSAHDAGLLLLLAIGCTLVPFALSLVALRHLSAFGAQLVVNLEPVYAILLAIPLLGEQRELGPSFYAGVCIILGAVFAEPLLERARKRRTPAAGSTEGSQLGLRE
ncbi:DMT family transporter [Aggregicoccus sp. 17bor-14]|uniref:DMT family transporter n=1 Tax=Myxococcaceae TaxID=31 RepID=UPI00129CB077|nr:MULTISPECIES: DMT family transporter [Myxococcaceae]MBF5042375.1 DMT family transporter [Simulacricoccus sp. 17bor-14]MRI88148.1 DMT family transporter [Aggregicoccus sp. 17bor-14]